jgi:6-pyruvoyltetrahydropterin/6-carboxytetrahydropterin synthase
MAGHDIEAELPFRSSIRRIAAPQFPPRRIRLEAEYDVSVVKDSLVFSAAHFITYAGNLCERIHGHNYRVEVEVKGPLDENHYVFDFIALRDAAAKIALSLDHHVLLPTESQLIRVTKGEKETTAHFQDKRWVFPNEDCVLLPMPNTTAELLGRWFGERLLDELKAKSGVTPQELRVSVEENFGQWAGCTIRPLLMD